MAKAWMLVFVLLASLQGDLLMANEVLEPAEVDSTVLQAGEGNVTIISVDSTNLRFSPSAVTVTEGDTVRFFWSGQALPHNAVEANGVFDSGEPARAVDYAFTFEPGTNGTYDFVCEPHAAVGMVGQITVEPAPPSTNTTNETNQSLPVDDGEDMRFIPAGLALTAVLWAAVVRRANHSGSGCNQPKMSSSVSF